MGKFNLQLALEQFTDLFRLMLIRLGDEVTPESSVHERALNKLIKITLVASQKAGNNARPLSELVQIETILKNELESYPVASLTEKLLDNLREFKAAL